MFDAQIIQGHNQTKVKASQWWSDWPIQYGF